MCVCMCILVSCVWVCVHRRVYVCLSVSKKSWKSMDRTLEVGGAPAISRGQSLFSPSLESQRSQSSERGGDFPKARQWQRELEASVSLSCQSTCLPTHPTPAHCQGQQLQPPCHPSRKANWAHHLPRALNWLWRRRNYPGTRASVLGCE